MASIGGIIITLFSTIILVSQNIYSKVLFSEKKVHEIALVMNVAGLAFFVNLPLLFFESDSISLPEVCKKLHFLLLVYLNFFLINRQ